MEKIIREQYARELQYIAVGGRLPEWREEKSKIINYLANDKDGMYCAWNDGNVFLFCDNKILPLRPIAENNEIKVFAVKTKGSMKGHMVILGRGQYKTGEIGSSPMMLKLLGKTVAIKLVVHAGVVWKLFSLSLAHNANLGIYEHMEYVRDFDYYPKEQLFGVKGFVPDSDRLETKYFVEEDNKYGNKLVLSDKIPAVKYENELIVVENVLSVGDVSEIMPTKYWYNYGDAFE